MAAVQCVLLGVAEVKVPIKRLPQETLTRVAEVAYWTLLHEDQGSVHVEDFSKDRETFIGEVDNYYSLREVEVRVNEEMEECQIVHSNNIILQHNTKDVATLVPLKEFFRAVYISKSDSFGRTAVVLDLKSEEARQQLFALFPNATRAPLANNSCVQSPVKEHKSSLGRTMGKKFATMLMASLSGTASSPKKSPLPTRRVIKTPEPKESIDNDSDSSSEEDSVSDDTDSKSTGGYYEDMGLDATVQERLYDPQGSDAASRVSDSSLEINAQIIEAELKFFLETNRDFLKCLQSLGEDRERLASADTPQFLRGKVVLLFSQIKTLTEIHTQLHEKFENSGGNLQKLSEAIISHEKDYEKYVYFMENIPVVDNILATCKDYIKDNMPELPEKLRKPRMRLHYYVLTLETLCKKSSCSKDKEALNKAISVLKVPLKKADSKLFLGAVVGSPVDLSNFGDLLRHSDLSLRRGGDLPRRVYHVLMLKTLIILTVRDGRNYNYVTSFRMDQVGLGTQERGLIFDLKVRNGPRGQTVMYSFKAKTINLQQQWINDLKDITKDKSQSNTSRNSYIDGDTETRTSGKRHRVSRGQSVEKLILNVSPIVASAPGGLDESDRSSATENSTSRSGRKGAIRKSSTMSSKSNPVARQQSGSLSDSEGSWNRRRTGDQLPPLSVWANFPILKCIYYQTYDFSRTFNSTPVRVEETFIEDIRGILGDVLSEQLCPPKCILLPLRNIIDFHINVFLPMIEKASSGVDIAQCFVDCSGNIRSLYSEYFVELAMCYEELVEDDSLQRFERPLNQFVNYVEMLLIHRSRKQNVIPQVQMALSTLQQCVLDANVILLTQNVKGEPFDLGEHAPILLDGPARVRRPGIVIRQELHLVLLESMLLVLEPHSTSFHYVDALRMDTVGLGPMVDKYTFQLEVRLAANKTSLWTFRTPKAETKEQWVLQISKLLYLQVERLKEKQKRRLGTNQGELVTLGESEPLYLNDVKKAAPEDSAQPLETEL